MSLKIPDWKKRRIALQVNQQGIEVTPDQVPVVAQRAIDKVRAYMVAKGCEQFRTMPDEELMEQMKAALLAEDMT